MNLKFKEVYRDFSDDAISREIEYENDIYTLTVIYPFDANPVKRIITCDPKKGSGMCRIIVDEAYDNILISDMLLSTINVKNIDSVIDKLRTVKAVVFEIQFLLSQGIPEP